MAVSNEELPLVCRVLELIEVKSDEIVEKVALHLATKHVESGAEYVQRVTISPSGPSARGDRARPLPGSCKL